MVNCLRLYIILSDSETKGTGEGSIYHRKCLAELEAKPDQLIDFRPVNLHPLFSFWKHGSVCDLEKKLGPKYGVQKIREEAVGPLLFWNNNDPVFCTLLIAPQIFRPFAGSAGQTQGRHWRGARAQAR